MFVGILCTPDMGVVILVIGKLFANPARDPYLVKGVTATPVVLDNCSQVGPDHFKGLPVKDHLHHFHLDPFCNLGVVASPDLETDDIDLIDNLPLLPGKVAGIPFFLSGLEETAIDLFEFDRKVVSTGIQFPFPQNPRNFHSTPFR